MKNIKQLTEFSNWIDNTINSVIVEKQEPKDDRSVERQRDITYLAKQKYPDYPAAQAIELYLADKLTDIEQRDAEQNRIINLQRRENQQLRTNMSSLRKELDDVETSGKEVDAEIERLKQLSGKIQTDVQQRRASTREVDELLKQVEQLKNKPGVTPDQYKEMRDRVEKFEKEKVNPEELKKFQGSLEQLSAKDELDKSDIARLQTQLQDVESKVGAATKVSDIAGVSSKIQDIIKRQQDFEQGNKELEQKLQSLKDVQSPDLSRATQLLKDIEQTRDDITKKQTELENQEQNFQKRIEQELSSTKERQKKYRKSVQTRSKQAKTKIDALVGKEATLDQIRQLGDELRSLLKQRDSLSTILDKERSSDQAFRDLMGKLGLRSVQGRNRGPGGSETQDIDRRPPDNGPKSSPGQGNLFTDDDRVIGGRRRDDLPSRPPNGDEDDDDRQSKLLENATITRVLQTLDRVLTKSIGEQVSKWL